MKVLLKKIVYLYYQFYHDIWTKNVRRQNERQFQKYCCME